MSLVRKHIFLAGYFCLVTILSFAGEKVIMIGSGYKQIKYGSHNTTLHSGRYFNGGFSFLTEGKTKQKVQFQVSNSNRELNLDLPYVSASTGINLFYDLSFRTIKTKSFENHSGIFIGNEFLLNFFPRFDNKNFLWENYSMTGISSLNSLNLKRNARVDLNFRIPFYTNVIFNRMDRFSGDVPGDAPAIQYGGSLKKVLNVKYELGYVKSKFGLKLGLYYQGEFIKAGRTPYTKVNTLTQSLSLRILYK